MKGPTVGHSSLLGPEHAPQEPAGRDNAALGPSDSSDSGSDRAGLPDQADSDAAGTGESRGVGAAGAAPEASDIGVDRVFTPGRRRRMKSDAGQRLHDDEDSDLGFVDTAPAPDPLEDEDVDPGGMDEDDNIPGSSISSQQPGAPPADRPDREPEPIEKPQPGDGDAEPPADEKDQREKQPGRARLLLRRLVRSAA